MKKYFITYTKENDVIWGLGLSKSASIKDAKNGSKDIIDLKYLN